MPTDGFRTIVGGGLAALALTTTAACQSEGRSTGEAELAPRGYVVYGHSGWGCRVCGYANSPFLGVTAMGTVKIGFDPLAPVSLVGIVSPDGESGVAGVDEEGIYAEISGLELRGQDLIDWQLVFSDGRDLHHARIALADEHSDWVEGHPIMTYQILHRYFDPETGDLVEADLCAGFTPDETTITTIYGETYLPPHYEPQPGQTDAFTFACQGHVLAKMKFMGKGPNDPFDAYSSTTDERLATTRMLRADHCGDGVANTVQGQPLEFFDRNGHFPFDPDKYEAEAAEALWTPGGALCLNEPRVGLRSDVSCHLDLPLCGEEVLDTSVSYYVTFAK